MPYPLIALGFNQTPYLGPTSVTRLIVAGGNAGTTGETVGAGGQVLSGTSSVSGGTTYTITVGGNTTASSAFGLTANTGSEGTSGSGFVKGASLSFFNSGYGDTAYSNGGGGGASGNGLSGSFSAGGDGTNAFGGNGGPGVTSSISGTSTIYGIGGGGFASSVFDYYNTQQGIAYGGEGVGAGGPGKGASNTQLYGYSFGPGFVNGSAGTANRGNGGGAFGFNGGSGIVIISYPNTFANAASTTGSPGFTNTGGNKIYSFTGSGSITF